LSVTDFVYATVFFAYDNEEGRVWFRTVRDTAFDHICALRNTPDDRFCRIELQSLLGSVFCLFLHFDLGIDIYDRMMTILCHDPCLLLWRSLLKRGVFLSFFRFFASQSRPLRNERRKRMSCWSDYCGVSEGTKENKKKNRRKKEEEESSP